MSKVRVDGAWRQPTVTRVKVDGVWRQAAVMYAKVNGVWKTTTFAGPPAAPVLAYTAQGQFTIQNYDATLTYVVAGATRVGAVLSSVSDGATVKTAYSAGSPESAASTMKVAAHARVLDSVATQLHCVVCQPSTCGVLCCPGGTIMNVDGSTCAGPGGTGHPNCPECGGAPCVQLHPTCWNWHWTDYSSSGYTLIGSVWGKAINA